MKKPFELKRKIKCKKTVEEIIDILSNPPLTIGSRVYKKTKISTKNTTTEILLLPIASFPSEKNAGVPVIKIEVAEQSNRNTINVCFELPKGLRIIGTILLPIVFLFGLAAIISFFKNKIEYFFVACIPWFVEIFGILLIWILFKVSTRHLLRDIISRLRQ